MAFPRTVLPEKVSSLKVVSGLRSTTQFGGSQLRGTSARGFEWTEVFNMLRSGDPDSEELMAFVRNAWNRSQSFTIDVPNKPGSGFEPNGTGSSGVTVSGGGQTGSTFNTTGWPVSTSNVVVAGDMISIAGVDHVFEVQANANSDGSGNATIEVNPPLYSGSSPSGGASITTTNVQLSAFISSMEMPDTVDGFNYGPLNITFREFF